MGWENTSNLFATVKNTWKVFRGCRTSPLRVRFTVSLNPPERCCALREFMLVSLLYTNEVLGC